MTPPPRSGPRSRLRGRSGSLLVEALASLTVGALILGGLVQASGLLLRVLDRSVVHVQDVERLDRAISALRRDIGRAVRTRWAGREPRAFVFEGTPTRLIFVAPGGGGTEGVPRAERVVLLSSIAGFGTGRVARTEAVLESGTSGPEGLVFEPARDLYAGPAHLRFRYVAAPVREADPPVTLPSWAPGPTLPEAVLLEALDPATGRVLLAARAHLRVDADIGCIDPRGGVCGLSGRQEPADRGAGSREAPRDGDGARMSEQAGMSRATDPARLP